MFFSQYVAFLFLRPQWYLLGWYPFEIMRSVSGRGQWRQLFFDYYFRKRIEKNSEPHDYIQHFVKLLLNHIPQLWSHLSVYHLKQFVGWPVGFFLPVSVQSRKKKSHCHIESLFLWLRGIKLLFLPRLSGSSEEKLKGKGSLYCPSLCKVTKGTEKGEWCELLKICYQVAERDFSKWDLFS